VTAGSGSAVSSSVSKAGPPAEVVGGSQGPSTPDPRSLSLRQQAEGSPSAHSDSSCDEYVKRPSEVLDHPRRLHHGLADRSRASARGVTSHHPRPDLARRATQPQGWRCQEDSGCSPRGVDQGADRGRSGQSGAEGGLSGLPGRGVLPRERGTRGCSRGSTSKIFQSHPPAGGRTTRDRESAGTHLR